jgi:hypothetical protein
LGVVLARAQARRQIPASPSQVDAEGTVAVLSFVGAGNPFLVSLGIVLRKSVQVQSYLPGLFHLLDQLDHVLDRIKEGVHRAADVHHHRHPPGVTGIDLVMFLYPL